jgi:septal ring factor EnvC (AmiA/AmiB activator)
VKQAAVQKLLSEVKTQKGTVCTINKDIQEIEKRKEKIIKDNGDSELEIKKLEHEIARIQSESKECYSKVRVLTSVLCWYWCVKTKIFNIKHCFSFNSLRQKKNFQQV